MKKRSPIVKSNLDIDEVTQRSDSPSTSSRRDFLKLTTLISKHNMICLTSFLLFAIILKYEF
jgi:hypothetical protein